MKKSIALIIVATIITGIIVICIAGFNFDILNKEHKQIQINIGEEFTNQDIKNIVSEVIEGQVEVQKTGSFEDQVVISVKEINDEQKEQIVTKINEKYQKELNAQDINIVSIPKVRLMDIIVPYIGSIIIVTALVLVYLSLKYKKQGIIKVILKTLLSLMFVELFVLSIIALLRIPTGQNLISIIFVTYILTLFGITCCLENKAQKLKIEEKKENN